MREPPPQVIAQAVARIANPGFDRWMTLVHASGCCARPVRLSGRIVTVDPATGETSIAYSTSGEPERVLLKACGTRRATRCPACAAVYQGDARALIIAGLAGGKGIPDTIGAHPTVFATFTAPSFGAVHTATEPSGRRCHPVLRCRCPQRRLIGCGQHHPTGDPLIGTPVCLDCYDYDATIIWNARATELWARTCNGVRRSLARVIGIRVRTFAENYQLSFVKVVEYQRRGVVHLHALLRVDRRDGGPAPIDTGELAAAVRVAAGRAQAPNPLVGRAPIVWGQQLDVDIVDTERRRSAANYLAKYATKSTDDNGALDRRIHHPDTSRLELPEHLRRLIAAAWTLGSQSDLGPLNLHLWAHTLGYRGHWLTKSRNWSTTFGALRTARHEWRREQQAGGRNRETIELPDLTYKGTGHLSEGDAWLAGSAAEGLRIIRRTAWEER